MPDRGKIIQRLNYLTAYGAFSEEWKQALRGAVELLAEHEPVEPGTSFDRPVCGVCGYHLILMDNYCPRCGREVKWDA